MTIRREWWHQYHGGFHEEEGFCDCIPTLMVAFNNSAFKGKEPTIERIRKKYELNESEIDPEAIQVMRSEGKVWVRIEVEAAHRLEQQKPLGFSEVFYPGPRGGQPGGP